MKIDEKILEGNYRELWLMERVNVPFATSVAIIQEKWSLPVTGGREKAKENCQKFFSRLSKEDQEFFRSKRFTELASVINKIAKLKLPKERKKKTYREILIDLPSEKFSEDIKNLIKEFDFEEVWLPYLAFYVIVGLILPPCEKLSGDISPPSVYEHERIFNLAIKKKTQREFLRKRYRFRGRRRKADSKGKYIDDVGGTYDEKEYLPSRLIRDYSTIADMVWGESENISIEEDERRVNRIKKAVQIFRSYFVPLSPKKYQRLRRIFGK